TVEIRSHLIFHVTYSPATGWVATHIHRGDALVVNERDVDVDAAHEEAANAHAIMLRTVAIAAGNDAVRGEYFAHLFNGFAVDYNRAYRPVAARLEAQQAERAIAYNQGAADAQN